MSERLSQQQEAELAAYYQQHKDDDDAWGEVEPTPASVGRRALDATITVRFSAAEAEQIRQLAKAHGLSYSAIVRRAVAHFTQPTIEVQQTAEANYFFNAGQTATSCSTGRVLESSFPEPATGFRR